MLSDVHLDLKIDFFFWKSMFSLFSPFCLFTNSHVFEIIQDVYGKYMCKYCFNVWISFFSIAMSALSTKKNLFFFS